MKDDQVNEGTELAAVTVESERQLTGLALDRAVTERVMRWKRVHSDRDAGDDRKDIAWMLLKDRVLKGEPYTWGDGDGLYDRTFAKWSPSTDIAAAMEVENRIAELGLIEDYIEALESEIAVWYEADVKDKFRLIHATPEQRGRAALAAIEASNQHAALGGTADQGSVKG